MTQQVWAGPEMLLVDAPSQSQETGLQMALLSDLLQESAKICLLTHPKSMSKSASPFH